MTTLVLEAFQVSQQYLGLLTGGGSYTENVSNNAHAGKKIRHAGKDD